MFGHGFRVSVGGVEDSRRVRRAGGSSRSLKGWRGCVEVMGIDVSDFSVEDIVWFGCGDDVGS